MKTFLLVLLLSGEPVAITSVPEWQCKVAAAFSWLPITSAYTIECRERSPRALFDQDSNRGTFGYAQGDDSVAFGS